MLRHGTAKNVTKCPSNPDKQQHEGIALCKSAGIISGPIIKLANSKNADALVNFRTTLFMDGTNGMKQISDEKMAGFFACWFIFDDITTELG